MQQSEFPQSGSAQTAPAANCTCANHANSTTITDEELNALRKLMTVIPDLESLSRIAKSFSGVSKTLTEKLKSK